MIGVVTAFKVNNYGSKLQAYAVCRKLNRLGYDCEIIDYVPRGDLRAATVLRKVFSPEKNLYRYNALKTKLQNKKHHLTEKLAARNRAICSLDSIYPMSAPISGYGNLTRLSEKYSTIVFGSDQIWRPDGIKEGFTGGEFTDRPCKVAFSPSFGVSELPAGMADRYRRILTGFKTLSCREERGAELIRELIGAEVPVLPDPTLSLEVQDWNEFQSHAVLELPKERYIFCYFLGGSSRHRDAVRELKRITGCRVIGLPHFKGYVPSDDTSLDIPLYDVNPADFVRLIANAAYVCTDSFHGTVFSSIYERDVLCFMRYGEADRGSTNSRMSGLIRRFGLEDRVVSAPEDVKRAAESRIDYPRLRAYLEAERGRLDRYLAGALE